MTAALEMRRRQVIVMAAFALACDKEQGRSTHLVVSSEPSCAKCSIEKRKLFTIGGPHDSLDVLPYMLTVARDSRGLVYVGPTKAQKILIYDSTGTLLVSFGREGKGPGEFAGISGFVIGPADSLVVVDQNGVLAFSPDRIYIRKAPSLINAQAYSLLLLPNGELARGMVRWDTSSPVRVTRGDSAPLAFGRSDADSGQGYMTLSFPVIFAGRKGSIWVPRNLEYRLDEWTLRGEHLRSITRRAEWFPKWAVEDIRANQKGTLRYEDGPRPWLEGAYQDSEGLIWTYAGRGDEEWKSVTLLKKQGTRPYTELAPETRNDFYDTVIEVIDPDNGRLLTSLRADEVLRPVLGSKFVWGYRIDADGELYIDIWSLSLRRQ
jgi:hypothetical protein